MLALVPLVLLSAPGAAPGPLPQCPPDWKVEVVAAPPQLKHPSVVCCAPDGRVFVAEDPMDMGNDSSKPTDRILCFHPDGKITVFAENLYAVFGLAYIDGKVYVHHCPKFSVFTDDNGVGKDRKDLIATTNPRPNTGFNDHIPANIRLGMDGWLYMSVGDKGIFGAVGTDGSKAELRGGGVIRLRPDGTKLEVFSRGTRNHLDVALNAEDEIFTYDNTDDGNGWWTRVTHMVDGGAYGYPWDYKPRRPYTLWMMTDYGGGSPTGALAYNEDALPESYRGNLFMCEWGRKQLLRLTVERDGGSYKIVNRENFLTAGTTEFRPVGIAVSPDGMSLYVADWNYGGWKQPVVAGRLLKVTYTGAASAAVEKPKWYVPAASGKPFEATVAELTKGLFHPAQAVRLVAQRRLAERGAEAVEAVTAVLADPKAPPRARWSAIWTLDAIGGKVATDAVLKVLTDADASVRRQAARQLGNRGVKDAVPALTKLLDDKDASVRFHAATALGRIGDASAMTALQKVLGQTDLFARYAAFTALNRIGRASPTAWPQIVSGLTDTAPAIREASAFALRETFDAALVDALRDFAADPKRGTDARVVALKLLADASRQPPAWDGKWWGTQPVKSPPPPHTVEWAGTPVAFKAIRALLADADAKVRVAAVEAIAAAGGPESTADLVAAFNASSDLVQKRAVLRSLAAIKATAPGVDLVASVLGKPTEDESLLAEAATAAGKIGGAKMIAALTKFAEGTAPAAPLAAAIDELGTLKATAAVPAIARALKHDNEKVRTAAINALATIGGEPAVTALASLLEDKSAAVRRAAVVALGAAHHKSAVAPLLKAFADPETRAEAITALTATPDVRALDAYLEGLASKTASVREAARTAVGAIRDDALPLIEGRLDKTPALPAAVVADLQRVYTVPVAVKTWRVIGSFDGKAADPFDPAAPDFDREYPDARNKAVKWKPARVDRAGKVDLKGQGFGLTDEAFAFGAAEVESTTAGPVEVVAGSDDGLIVWVNGKKVFERLGNRAYKPDEFHFKADLKAGKNLIVVKVTQGGGPWEFSLAVPPPGTGKLFQTKARVVDPAEYAKFATANTGSAERGRKVYADLKGAACIKCHATGTDPSSGGEVGPSLVGIATKYNRQQLIESVLYPSKQILDGYQQTRIVTTSEQVKIGIVRSMTPEELTLVDADGKKIVLKKEDVAEQKVLEKSIMPEGLQAGLSPQEFADLIAYLESLNQKPPEKK